MNFNNISSLNNARYSLSLHQNEIILAFLSRWWLSTMFGHWLTSDVLFLFINMRSFYNFSHDDELQQYFIIDQRSLFLFSSSKWDQFRISPTMMNFNNILIIDKRPMFFLSSSTWDHSRISLIMVNFNNVWSLINVRCSSFLHHDQIISAFPSVWWISKISSLIKVRCSFSLHQHEITLEFPSLWWISRMFDHWPTSYALLFFIKSRLF